MVSSWVAGLFRSSWVIVDGGKQGAAIILGKRLGQPMNRFTSLKVFSAVILLAGLSGCVGSADFVSNSASMISDQESSLFRLLLILAGFVFIIVEGGIIYAVVRYRRRRNDTTEPRQVYANGPMEIIWAVNP